jgi:hypothetical protein
MNLTDTILDIFKNDKTITKDDGTALWTLLHNGSVFPRFSNNLEDLKDLGSSFRGLGRMIADAINHKTKGKTSYNYMDFYCKYAPLESVHKMHIKFLEAGYIVITDAMGAIQFW